MFCRNCGNEISEQVKFCPKCGAAVSVEENRAVPKKRKGKKILIAVIVVLVIFIMLPKGSNTPVSAGQNPELLTILEETEIALSKAFEDHNLLEDPQLDDEALQEYPRQHD